MRDTAEVGRPSEGSFVRWQSIAIAQLGYVVNLILTLSTASLGFAFALIDHREFSLSPCGKALLLMSVGLLVVSAGLGVCCNINRLNDFRKTRSIARDREVWKRDLALTDEQINSRLHDRREETDRLGNKTWTIFYSQILTFAIGDFALTIASIIAYHQKLF